MANWKIKTHKKIKPGKPILIEGMPGIGNVGKIAADMIVEQLKADKIISFSSSCLPNSVFVKENNMVELPKIEIWHKKVAKQDFLFLTGDVQPMKEEDSYSFTESVLSVAKRYKVKEIVALGGIGLSEPPMNSRVFVTGNDKDLIKEFVKLGANDKLYGFVGPIMGVTGLLLGLSKDYGIKAVSLLGETYASPMHIGLAEARGLMKTLQKKYSLGLDLTKLEKDMKRLENALKPVSKQLELQESKERQQDTSYIG